METKLNKYYTKHVQSSDKCCRWKKVKKVVRNITTGSFNYSVYSKGTFKISQQMEKDVIDLKRVPHYL